MSLKPIRQVEQVNVDFICPFTQERGGIASLLVASGMYMASYAYSASGARPLGIQLNDLQNIDLSRQIDPRRLEMTDFPCGIVGLSMQGDYTTDWIYPVGTITTGDIAYVGPSGMFTNDSSLGGNEVGKFLSSVVSDPHTVTFQGLGFTREFVDPCDKTIKIENDPKDAILLATPGYIKVRVKL